MHTYKPGKFVQVKVTKAVYRALMAWRVVVLEMRAGWGTHKF